MRVFAVLIWLLPGLGLTTSTGRFEGNVTCIHVSIPNMTAVLPYYKAARICYPTPAVVKASGLPTPALHLWAHADFGGGPMAAAYDHLQEEIAGYGFCVAEYLSCAVDQECSWSNNGETSFLELLKTARFLEEHQREWSDKVDLSKSYSISGHSTGARVVLMLAALRDTPAYLRSVPAIASLITPAMRKSLEKIAAVVADHPDMMYLGRYNPDIVHYNISRTATMILTGSKDTSIEAPGSAWRDFQLIEGHNKAFFDLLGADHSEPVERHRGGPFIARWSQLFALGDETAAPYIFGSGPESIQKVLPVTPPGGTNTGDGRVGFLACREKEGKVVAVPAEYAEYC